MDRRSFLQHGCAVCISAAAATFTLNSCASNRYITGKLGADGLFVNRDEFHIRKNGADAYRSYVIIRNEQLQYPICLYRFSDTEYTALWMSCTHQGAELQAAGSYLQCPAHGSEFNNRGVLTSGPADRSLRSFPVTVQQNELFIDLRAV